MLSSVYGIKRDIYTGLCFWNDTKLKWHCAQIRGISTHKVMELLFLYLVTKLLAGLLFNCKDKDKVRITFSY